MHIIIFALYAFWNMVIKRKSYYYLFFIILNSFNYILKTKQEYNAKVKRESTWCRSLSWIVWIIEIIYAYTLVLDRRDIPTLGLSVSLNGEDK